MKNERQKKIVELIEKYDISTQELLIDKLREEGFDTTQTTISRDIRQLHLVKGPDGKGSYKYVLSGSAKDSFNAPAHTSAIKEAVIHIESAQNIVVVRTHSGMANAVAVCLDSIKHGHIIGSVAGDDTILIVAKDGRGAEIIEDELKGIFSR